MLLGGAAVSRPRCEGFAPLGSVPLTIWGAGVAFYLLNAACKPF